MEKKTICNTFSLNQRASDLWPGEIKKLHFVPPGFKEKKIILILTFLFRIFIFMKKKLSFSQKKSHLLLKVFKVLKHISCHFTAGFMKTVPAVYTLLIKTFYLTHIIQRVKGAVLRKHTVFDLKLKIQFILFVYIHKSN